MKANKTFKLRDIVIIVIIITLVGIIVSGLIERNPPEAFNQKIESSQITISEKSSKEEIANWLESQVKNMSEIVSIKREDNILYIVRDFRNYNRIMINVINLSKIKEIKLSSKEGFSCILWFKSEVGKRPFEYILTISEKSESKYNLDYLKNQIKENRKMYYSPGSSMRIVLDKECTLKENLRLSWYKAITHLTRLCGGCKINKK